MDINELILLDSRKVRGSSDLMSIYISAYEKQFGKKPNCAGCTFANDWKRFILAVRSGSNPTRLTSNKREMENTFKIKKIQSKILSYRANGKTYRLYDNNLNENFVIGYLTNGTEEEIKQRKAMFTLIPEQLREPKKAKSEEPKQEEEVQVSEEVETVTEEPVQEQKKTRKKRGSNKSK